MKKIVIHSPGGYEKLKLETHPTPSPKTGEVLVQIKACGVNYADIAVRWGLYASAKKYVGWPITPGFEFAGIIEATGPNVNHFKSGQKVFGISLFEAYSSHIIVREHQIFLLPLNMSFEQAAGFPAVFMTAYHALFQNIRLRKEMTLLVHSAAGGVGTALLQLGRLNGCKMVGVVGSAHKIGTAKNFGAQEVIDKSSENLWKKAKALSPHGYDVILDANGVETLKQSYEHLAPTGKLISYGFHTMLPKSASKSEGRLNYFKLAWNYLKTPKFNPIHMTNANKSIITFNLSFLFNQNDLLNEAMTDLLQWLNDGKIVPPKITTYPLEAVSQAHQALESGQTTGKLVLTIEEQS